MEHLLSYAILILISPSHGVFSACSIKSGYVRTKTLNFYHFTPLGLMKIYADILYINKQIVTLQLRYNTLPKMENINLHSTLSLCLQYHKITLIHLINRVVQIILLGTIGQNKVSVEWLSKCCDMYGKVSPAKAL